MQRYFLRTDNNTARRAALPRAIKYMNKYTATSFFIGIFLAIQSLFFFCAGMAVIVLNGGFIGFILVFISFFTTYFSRLAAVFDSILNDIIFVKNLYGKKELHLDSVKFIAFNEHPLWDETTYVHIVMKSGFIYYGGASSLKCVQSAIDNSPWAVRVSSTRFKYKYIFNTPNVTAC